MSNADDVEYAVERLGVSRGRLHVVAQGLDDATIVAAGRRLIDPREPTIVSIGTFIARKGVAYVVQAATDLMRADARVRIRFLGTGVDAETVRTTFPTELHDRVEVVPRYRATSWWTSSEARRSACSRRSARARRSRCSS